MTLVNTSFLWDPTLYTSLHPCLLGNPLPLVPQSSLPSTPSNNQACQAPGRTRVRPKKPNPQAGQENPRLPLLHGRYLARPTPRSYGLVNQAKQARTHHPSNPPTDSAAQAAVEVHGKFQLLLICESLQVPFPALQSSSASSSTRHCWVTKR